MKRVVKTADVRKAEILKIAGTLFQSQGYALTSVDEIVRQADIAKGTFYYYFKSKEEVLEALTQQLVTEMATQLKLIADHPEMSALEKMRQIIGQSHTQESEQQLFESMHRPENRALHDRINIKTVQIFGSIIAAVVTQGNQEGVFQVDDPLSTVQFILAGSQSLLGDGVFNWTPEEEAARTRAMLTLVERACAAPRGSLTPN